MIGVSEVSDNVDHNTFSFFLLNINLRNNYQFTVAITKKDGDEASVVGPVIGGLFGVIILALLAAIGFIYYRRR